MTIGLALLSSVTLLLLCTIKGVYIAYPLLMYFGAICGYLLATRIFDAGTLADELSGQSESAAGIYNFDFNRSAAFLLTSLVSLLIGTVIAGAYLGDRCSPMSSSAHLVSCNDI